MDESPADLLATIDITSDAELQPWRERWERQHGEHCVFWIPLFREASKRNCELYHPQLKAFTAECRAQPPPPELAEMTAAEREQHRPLTVRFREMCPGEERDRQRLTDPDPGLASHLLTSRAGLRAAADAFERIGAAVLTVDEWSQ